MKTVFAMILVFSIYDATADEIVVTRMGRTQGYADRFDLRSSFSGDLALDCQSFIQGLLFGPKESSQAILMYDWECQELRDEMKKSFSHLKKHCLEVDFDKAVLSSHGTCKTL